MFVARGAKRMVAEKARMHARWRAPMRDSQLPRLHYHAAHVTDKER